MDIGEIQEIGERTITVPKPSPARTPAPAAPRKAPEKVPA